MSKRKREEDDSQSLSDRKRHQTETTGDVDVGETVVEANRRKFGPATTRTLPFSASKLKFPTFRKFKTKATSKLWNMIKSYVTNYNHITYKANVTMNVLFHYVESDNFWNETKDLDKVYEVVCRFVMAPKKTTNHLKNLIQQFPDAASMVRRLQFWGTCKPIQQNALGFATTEFIKDLKNLKETHDVAMVRQQLELEYEDALPPKHMKTLSKFIVWRIHSGWSPKNGFELFGENIRYTLKLIFNSFPSNLCSSTLLAWRAKLKRTIQSGAKEGSSNNKMFNLAPIHSTKVRHAYIDKKVLADMALIGCQTADLKQLTLNDFFKQDLTSLAPGRWPEYDKFPLSATTNGFEIHFVYQRTEKDHPMDTSFPFDNLKICKRFVKDEVIKAHEVTATDPGVKNIFTTCTAYVVEDELRIPRIRKVTAKEFRHNSLTTILSRKADARLQDVKPLIQELSNNPLKAFLPSDTVADLVNVTKRHYEIYREVYRRMNHAKYLKFKAFARMRRQREFDRIVNEVLTFGIKPTPVVAMGNARNLHGFRKNVHGPARKLITHAKKKLVNPGGFVRGLFIDINESHTSKWTTCCLSKANYMKQKDRRYPIRGLLHCSQCKKTLCRDSSAAHNILKITLHNLGINLKQRVSKFPGAH